MVAGKQIPHIALNYEALVSGTLGEVGNRQIGLLIRGLCWSAEFGRDFVPVGVLHSWSDNAEEAREDIDRLVRAGLLVENEGRPTHLQLGEQAWLIAVRKRKPISRTVRDAVLARDGHRCRGCQATARLTIDHIRPWSRGGTDEPENLQTLCQSCNSTKGARV